MSRVIEVIVSPKGETSIQTKGYVGSDCLRASSFLEKALGIAGPEKKTPEFFQAAQAQQQIEQ